MIKLSSQEIQYLSYHQQTIDKAYKTQIYFCFDSKDSGSKAYEFLKKAYSDECNYDAWSGWFGIGDKRDFYLGFVSQKARDSVYDDIRNALDAFQSTNQYQNDFLSIDEPNNGGNPDTGTKNADWITYLIIGAAAVAVIMLLWDRKKK